MAPTAVVALGGHALLPKDLRPTMARQFQRTRRVMRKLAPLVRDGWGLAVTHGNGPQVGNILLQVEAARGKAYPVPLSVAVAESQGQIGYVVQQCLVNELATLGLSRPVVTLLTQVLVDPEDPAFTAPTKPIGPFYPGPRAQQLMRQGVPMRHYDGYGWRMVVASPRPLEIIEADTVRGLVRQGVVVIAGGGGGIPVVRRRGRLHGVDAVIDKDLTAAILAREMGAQLLLILTDVSKVALDYRKAGHRDLDAMTLSEARRYLAEGHFAPGSMGPKIEATVQFLEQGGERAIISTPEEMEEALAGHAGTHIVP